MKLVEEKPVSLLEAKNILEKLEKERDALGYEQKVTLDFMKAYVQLDEKSVNEQKKNCRRKSQNSQNIMW
jgi:DNA-directed RNA polymerase subunit F